MSQKTFFIRFELRINYHRGWEVGIKTWRRVTAKSCFDDTNPQIISSPPNFFVIFSVRSPVMFQILIFPVTSRLTSQRGFGVIDFS